MMSSQVDCRTGGQSLPQFEQLEERLLLTTLYGGEEFYYLNSENQAVRINLDVGEDEAPTDAAIELLTYDDTMGGVTNLVGLFGGTPTTPQNWDTEGIVEQDDNGDWSWVAFSDDEENPARGAETEIYAIYVARWTPNTVLTIALLSASDVPDLLDPDTEIVTWGASSLPYLEGAEDIRAPSGSGGVVVGARRDMAYPDEVRYRADTYVDEDSLPVVDSHIGLFRGGPLAPGITFKGADGHFSYDMMDEPVGSDVQSVATDATGMSYVVNLGAFHGVIMNNGDEGVIGQGVSSIVSDSAGTFYAVDNSPPAVVGSPTNQDLGSASRTLAADDTGVFYAVNEADHHLVSWDQANGFRDIGELIDQSQSQFRFEDITAMDFNAIDGKLYAVGDIVDTDPDTDPEEPVPNGQFLITIDTTDGSVASRVLLNSGAGTFSGLAFAADGTCYGIIAENSRLVTIDTATGEVTTIGIVQADTGILGIDFIGQALYATTDTTLYQIDPTDATSTMFGPNRVGQYASINSLTYDPTRPGSLYTAAMGTYGDFFLTRIALGSSLVSIDSDGEATLVDFLFDPGDDTWVWADIDAMDHVAASGVFYGFATAVDLDPFDASDTPTGRRMVTIDPATGGVTDVVELTGTGNANALASDSAGDFYAIDNTPPAIVGNPTDQSFGTDAGILAADATGTFYIVDEANHRLVSWDQSNGFQDLGPLVDQGENQFLYQNITAMDFNPVTGTLYAIGNILDTDPVTAPAAPDPNGPFLITINAANGTVTSRVMLEDDAAFPAMAFASDGTCYAVMDVPDQDSALVTIDVTNGTITAVDALMEGDNTVSGIVGLDFIGLTLYGTTTDTIYQINASDATCTNFRSISLPTIDSLAYDVTRPGSLYAMTVGDVGDYLITRIPLGSSLLDVAATGEATLVEFLLYSTESTWVWAGANSLEYVDSSGAVYAIATVVDLDPFVVGPDSTEEQLQLIYASDAPPGVRLVTIDPATADVVEIAGLTGDVDSNSLAFDASQPGILWSTVDDGGYRLTRIDLSSTLVQSNGVNTATRIGLLLDPIEPVYAYMDVHALEFGAGDVLYGVGTILNLAPFQVADPDPFGPFLVTIDTATGLVSQIVQDVALDVADLSSMTYDAAHDVWYAVVPNATGDQFATVDMAAAGLVSPFQTMTDLETGDALTGFVGLDYEDGTLYAVTGDFVYTVDQDTAVCAGLVEAPFWTLTSLSGDDTLTGRLWTTVEQDGLYYLIAMDTEVEQMAQDQNIGRIMIAGTLAGISDIPRSIEVLEMGFLWGNVTVGTNTDAIIMRVGGGAVQLDDGYLTPSDSLITVGGTVNGIYSDSGTLYSAVQVENDLRISPPSTIIRQHELKSGDWSIGDLTGQWNDSMATAQFLNHPSGSFNLVDGILEVPGDDDDWTDLEDWYALPLMAGQTVIMDGSVGGCYVELRDFDGNWMDSFGFETIEDEGVGSRGRMPEPMVFTAPAAGIYYVRVVDDAIPGGSYSLSFTNGTAAALGGVGVVGDYYPMFWGTDSASDANVSTKLGGNLGAVSISGSSYYTVAHAIGGGDLVAFQAGEIGTILSNAYTTNTITSDGNIGRVASWVGFVAANITSGANGGFYNPDAYIQNVYSATDFVWAGGIQATGDIGVIEIDGTLEGVTIRVNSNLTNYAPGAGSRLGLLDVDGDYGGLTGIGVPALYHGPGGDIGYVQVGGTIHVSYDGWVAPVTEITFTDGRSTILNDDGGGRMTVTPVETSILDENGKPVLGEDHRPVTYTPEYSFAYIPVEDTVGGVGGVIANLRVNGSATFNTQGAVQIGDLDLFGAALTVTTTGEGNDLYAYIRFTGSGQAHVYYMNHAINTGNLNIILNISNGTGGNIVSGYLGAHVQSLTMHGSIGPVISKAGAWIHGWEDAPAVGDVTVEPQYGWFHRKINGLRVTGDIDTLAVYGSLHDLRVEGTIGTVTVNADRLTPANSWDGVKGIVWSNTRIDSIDVGDGLADDGSSDVAEAAIMSSASIGKVKINGQRFQSQILEPRRSPNIYNQTFGQLNGSIIALRNDFVDVLDWRGNVIGTAERDAIGSVVGTNGAHLTAMVLGMELDSFQCFKPGFVRTSGVGTVSFSGPGAEITGAEIAGHYVRKVSASLDSDGINHSYISGNSPRANQLVVGEVLAGGPGMSYVNVAANGGNIGTVKGVGPDADIRYSLFTSTKGMNYLGAVNLFNNGIHMPGTVKKISAAQDMRNNTPGVGGSVFGDSGIFVGAIDTIVVGGDFQNNSFFVAGRIGSMNIGGAFIDSYLSLTGPSTAYLKSLVVVGDISGTIISGGRIGSIISKTGLISADISTITDDWSGDVGLIQTALGYTGTLEVRGSLKKFISFVSLGDDPTVAGRPTMFNIWDDLDYLRVYGSLYSGINVGGDIGTIDVDGTFYSNVFTNGSLKKLVVDGGLGGMLTLQEDWTGYDGQGWPEEWTFVGDTDQLGARYIQNNRGRVIGDTGAGGSVIAYGENHAEDVDQSTLFNISADGMGFGLVARRADPDSDTYYLARVVAGGAAGDSLRIYKVVDGVMTELADTGLLYDTAGTDFKMRFSCTAAGSRTVLRVKMWDAAAAEPGAWAADVTDDDARLQDVRGRFGLYYDLSDVAFTQTDDYSATFSRGSLTVLGSIGSMRFSTTSDILADLTVGGSIKTISLRGGSIVGNITSRYGSISRIYLRDGSIVGNIQAVSLGTISVRNGDVLGDITASSGRIRSFSLSGGDLDADITAHSGGIDKFYIRNGSALAGNTIQADGDIGKIYVRNGDMLADVISGRRIRRFTVRNGSVGTVADAVAISAEGDIGRFRADSLVNSTVRSGGKISRLDVDVLQDAVVSAAWDIGTVRVRGNVTGSHVLAGYDIGPDGAIGGGDDAVHSGNIKRMDVLGTLDSSVVAAGIDPVDGDFTTLADNTDAAGVSRIRRMRVRGAVGGGSLIMADTYIDPKAPAAAVVAPTQGTVAGAGVDFGPETGGSTLTVGDLTLKLTGAGVGNYDAATNSLVLNRTTLRSRLTMKNTGANVNVTILGSDDSELRYLRTVGAVTLDDMTVHGLVKGLVADTAADGATWRLFAGVSSARIGTLTNVDVTVGQVGRWKMGALTGGSISGDAFGSFYAYGSVTGDVTSTLGEIRRFYVRGGDMDGDLTARGSIRTLYVTGNVNGDVTIGNGDLRTFRVKGDVTGVIESTYGYSRSVSITGEFSGSFRTHTGISRFTCGSFSGLLSTNGDLRSLRVRGQMSGKIRSGGSIRAARFGSMSEAFVSAANDLRSVRITGDMTDSSLFAGFDPGDAGYIVGEAGNVSIDAFEAPTVQPDQVDKLLGGSIRIVRISGNMTDSVISAGVGPGVDGYVGTDDDVTAGVGTVRRVQVTGGIIGSGGSTVSYGVFAASAMPTVYHWRNHVFDLNGTAHVGTLRTAAGPLKVTDVEVRFNTFTVYFNHPVNGSTLGTVYTGMDPESFTLIVSDDAIFDPLADTVVSATVPHTFTYDSQKYTATLKLGLGQTWETLGLGGFFQLTLDGSVIADSRGMLLDGEYAGSLPSGDDEAGGDFVYTSLTSDAPDSFDDPVTLPVTLDGGTMHLGGTFEFSGDVDIFSFAANAYDFFSIEYSGSAMAEMGVFFRDTQGTLADTSDDYFEVLARHEYTETPGGTIFEAFELPESGEYFVVVYPFMDAGSYDLAATLSSSDTGLLYDLGGALPADEEIAYVSNVIGDNNNNLGANDPKQLVYMDFDGGTATKYYDKYGAMVDVDAFDLADIDTSMAGYEDDMINGSADVAGIVDNVISIFTNTPASQPLGSLTVQRIDISDAVDWATYQAATEGLWFTTVDPAVAQGLDPETDFTTVFIGNADDTPFGGGLLGIASEIDVAGQSKADDALVFVQNFGYLNSYTSSNLTEELNQISMALSNVTAHELGHTLGLNHQPTNRVNFLLLADDPDNNPITPDDSNTGMGLMAYSSTTAMLDSLSELGTAELSSGEFPTGYIDTADLLLRWLS